MTISYENDGTRQKQLVRSSKIFYIIVLNINSFDCREKDQTKDPVVLFSNVSGQMTLSTGKGMTGNKGTTIMLLAHLSRRLICELIV